MKFFFVDGKKHGQEVALRPPGISLGRETDNDVVLEGEGDSRYHAKLEWRDGAWLIRDLGSTNGTKVNGERITEHRLKPGDRIRIGQQDFRFAEDQEAAPAGNAVPLVEVAPTSSPTSPTVIPAPAASPATSTIPSQTRQGISGAKSFQDFFSRRDAGSNASAGGLSSLFGGKSTASSQNQEGGLKRAHATPLFYIAVIGLAIIVVAGFIVWDTVISPPKQLPPPVAAARSPLLVVYEKQEASCDNIFRFRLEIRGNVIRLEKDDLKNNIRTAKQKEVGDKQLEDLEHFLRQTDFMNLKPPPPGVSPDDRDRRRELIVAYGREINQVEICNTFAPTAFEETVALVEDFSRNVLNTPAEYLTAEEMLREGNNAFAKGEELFRNFEARPRNLRDAITRFAYAVELLENFEPKPREYELAFQYRREAETIIKNRIQETSREAIRAYQLKDFAAARDAYRAIMEMTDPGEKVHEQARNNVLMLDEQLRRKRR